MKYLFSPDDDGITPLHAIIVLLFIILILGVVGGIEMGASLS